MGQKEHISYETFEQDCLALAHHLKESKAPIKRLVAVTRGGMVPTCLLAQWLNIQEIHVLALTSYTGEHTCANVKPLACSDFPDETETLFVDDLYDSGQTYHYIKQQYPNARIAVIYTKKEVPLDFPAVKKELGSWVVFPWEKEPLK